MYKYGNYLEKNFNCACSAIDGAHTKISFEYRYGTYRYLREFKAVFKMALAHESGGQRVPYFFRKKPRVENLFALSLS
jgi:hypothetical protein